MVDGVAAFVTRLGLGLLPLGGVVPGASVESHTDDERLPVVLSPVTEDGS